MKSILLSSVAAVLLMAATGAYAQQDDHQNGAHPDAGAQDTHTGGDNKMSGPADNHGAMDDHNAAMDDHKAMGTTTTKTKTRTTHRTKIRRGTTTNATRTDKTMSTDKTTMSTDRARDDHTATDQRGGDANNGNAHHAQVDAKLRIAVTATHHFHAGEYRAPQGYAYRRYDVGQRLEPAFYARDYWLTNYASYDLVAPPDGYTWVRFGPDAILIDEDTGDVVQVQYGVFD